MSFWRQLRWRIVGAQVVVVIVGVVVLFLTARIITSQHWLTPSVATDIGSCLGPVTTVDNSQIVEQSQINLLETFQNVVFFSLVVAAIASVIAGLGTSVWLVREILRPLRHIAECSQRIANGHYDERVLVPASDELAMMATHFNQMAEALEQIEQQRVALIGNVSHELRTPLSGLEGYLEGLIDGVFPNDEETFAHMFQEVRRLRRLVNDLQALSKTESGQIRLNIGTFDLVILIERVVTQLRPQARAQGLEIYYRDLPTVITTFADPDRTAQVLMNLIGNAIRYTPTGGQIKIRFELKKGFVTIAVEDTGIGIPKESLRYIFERFYRVDSSRSRRSGGSGIGLTISRHLAWAMGGELTATSDGIGQGSTFFFTLPLAHEIDLKK